MKHHLLHLPDELFKHHILQYFMLRDVVMLDNACINHQYRNEWFEKLRKVILIGDLKVGLKLNGLKWLNRREVYIQNFYINDILPITV